MPSHNAAARRTELRGVHALLAVLPRSAAAQAAPDSGSGLVVRGHRLNVMWVGEGNLGDVRRLIGSPQGPTDIVVARRLSPGAREALSEAHVNWVDETGAAEITLDSIIVSRSGRPPDAAERPARWTPSAVSAAEALLWGTRGTVSELSKATGLSAGTCTHALRFLEEAGFLEASAARGRRSARRLVDHRKLLDAYVDAAPRLQPAAALQVGAVWRDPVAGLADVGAQWDRNGVAWAATGAVAASVLAPHMSSVPTAVVYLGADTVIGLHTAAIDAGLRPIEGGRLTLRPFPSSVVERLTTSVDDLKVAPWPRVFVDLVASGVRGEEAAEHLWEVMHAR